MNYPVYKYQLVSPISSEQEQSIRAMDFYSSPHGLRTWVIIVCICALFFRHKWRISKGKQVCQQSVTSQRGRNGLSSLTGAGFKNLSSNPLCLQLYIVYLGDVKHEHPDDVVASHHDILATVLGRYYMVVSANNYQAISSCMLLLTVLSESSLSK